MTFQPIKFIFLHFSVLILLILPHLLLAQSINIQDVQSRLSSGTMTQDELRRLAQTMDCQQFQNFFPSLDCEALKQGQQIQQFSIPATNVPKNEPADTLESPSDRQKSPLTTQTQQGIAAPPIQKITPQEQQFQKYDPFLLEKKEEGDFRKEQQSFFPAFDPFLRDLPEQDFTSQPDSPAQPKTRPLLEEAPKLSECGIPSEKKGAEHPDCQLSAIERALQPVFIQGLYNKFSVRQPLLQFGYDQLKADRFRFDPIANTAPPENYKLGPGDEVIVHDSLSGSSENEKKVKRTSSEEEEEEPLGPIVDENGMLSISGYKPLSVSGLTLEEVNKKLQRYNKFLQVSLGKLRSIQVNVIGEAKSPGLHRVPGIASIYNILAMVGGIKKTGSLRHIQWKRDNQLVAEVDLYDYFLKGIPLENVYMDSGDTLFIPPLQKAIAVVGQVQKSGIYELKKATKLNDVLFLAGGLLPTANTGRILVERIVSNAGKTQKRLDLAISSSQKIQNFDIIKVFPIPENFSEATSQQIPSGDKDITGVYSDHSTIVIRGAVEQPGHYPFSKGITLKDALLQAKGMKLNAHREQIDIRRVTMGKNPILLRVSLNKPDALQTLLQPGDVILVHDNAELFKSITLTGKVKRPGNYPYLQDMTLGNALLLANGLEQQAYQERIYIRRASEKGHELVKVLLNTSGALDTPLQPGDTILVHDSGNLFKGITIRGEVNQPGIYPYFHNMTVEDVLFLAKGLGLYADRTKIGIQRILPDQEEHKSLRISLNSTGMQTKLQPDDEIIVFNKRKAGKNITILGEVWKPGIFQYSQGMTVEDALFQANGLTAKAFREKLDIQRQRDNGKKELIEVPLIRGSSAFVLEPEDTVVVHSVNLIASRNVAIQGINIQRPGSYPFIAGMTIKSLIFRAGGLTNKAIDPTVTVKRWERNGNQLQRKTIVLQIDPKNHETTPPFSLQEDDLVILRQLQEYSQPLRVTISGEVLYPGTYEFTKGAHLSDLIRRANGFTKNAFLSGAILTRKILKEKEDAVDDRINKDTRRSLLQSTVEAPTSIVDPNAQLTAAYAARQTLEEERQIKQGKTSDSEETELEAQTGNRQTQLTQTESQKIVESKEQAKIRETNIGRLIIRLTALNEFMGSPDDIELMDGDTLTIPPKLDSVLVKGETYGEASLLLKERATAYYYLSVLGGPRQLASLEEAYVLKGDGTIVQSNLDQYVIKAGDTIIVPPELTPEPNTLKTTQAIADIVFKTLTTIALLVTIL
ncbi:MAG: SLBB domain-containing protein [SAR324 cluster bacterium]|nr:SLBB domain-containing protein [SAR324 cluster bacterium]